MRVVSWLIALELHTALSYLVWMHCVTKLPEVRTHIAQGLPSLLERGCDPQMTQSHPVAIVDNALDHLEYQLLPGGLRIT